VADGRPVHLDDQPGILSAGQQRGQVEWFDGRTLAPPGRRGTRGLRLRFRGRVRVPVRSHLAHGLIVAGP
jgi:hypothetical protein